MGHRPQCRHSALVNALPDREAVKFRALLDQGVKDAMNTPDIELLNFSGLPPTQFPLDKTNRIG